jgi:hypothetical protein
VTATADALKAIRDQARRDTLTAARSCGEALSVAGKSFIATEIEGTLIVVACGRSKETLERWLPEGLCENDYDCPAEIEVATREQIKRIEAAS